MNNIQEAKRYHPAYLLVELFEFLRNSFFVILFLFIFNFDVMSGWIFWAKLLFLSAAAFTIVKIFLSWWLHTFEYDEETITLREGIFVKKVRTLAFERVQNKKTATTFVHNWFDLTSLTLETGTSNEEASVRFPVLKTDEAVAIIQRVERGGPAEPSSITLHKEIQNNSVPVQAEKSERVLHFHSTKKDTLRASFTSLSFLAIFPILLTLYSQVDEFLSIDDNAKNTVLYFTDNLWLLVPLFIVAIFISSAIGYVITTIRFGNYRIEADRERIYITRGVGQVHTFSIQRNKVQAVQIEQTLMKRILGIVEIRLISAEALSTEDGPAANSLYPFMKSQEAYELLAKLLPQYTVADQLERLPRNTIWLKLLRPYYVTIITAVALWFFKPSLLWIAGVLFGFSLVSRLFDYLFTRYTIDGNSIQIRTGSFTLTTFITRRNRIQEIDVSQSRIQRAFGVRSLGFTNRAKPIHVNKIQDVPDSLGNEFKQWFVQRNVKIE